MSIKIVKTITSYTITVISRCVETQGTKIEFRDIKFYWNGNNYFNWVRHYEYFEISTFDIVIIYSIS